MEKIRNDMNLYCRG